MTFANKVSGVRDFYLETVYPYILYGALHKVILHSIKSMVLGSIFGVSDVRSTKKILGEQF